MDIEEKLAAYKSRNSRRPIRASTLADKERVDKRSSHLKTANVYSAVKNFGIEALDTTKEHWVPIAIGTTSLGTGIVGKQTYDDWKLGRRVRKAQGG